MRIGNWLKAFEWTKVTFGEGYLDRLVVFECKYLFSIYYNRWNVVAHDRFHAHAFAAISIFLRGWYVERTLHEDSRTEWWQSRLTAPLIRFIPRDHHHRMMESSKDAISITIAGPWDKMWSETFLNGSRRILGWGRKVISQDCNVPYTANRSNG
jgi:hypothetical protein